MADIPKLRRVSALAGLAANTTETAAQDILMGEMPPLTILNLRGPADEAFCDAISRSCGCDLPVMPNSSNVSLYGEILKLGPNEWLLLAKPGSSWSENMAIPGGTLTDVSHGRVAMLIYGKKSGDMLAKGCAVDLHPKKFPPGTCIQTSIGRIGVILHKLQNDCGFVLYVARSYAASLWSWLSAAAEEYGYHVIGPETCNDMHLRQTGNTHASK